MPCRVMLMSQPRCCCLAAWLPAAHVPCVLPTPQTGKTKLTLEVLRLTVNLIDFGAYEDNKEIKALVVPLVNVLNGVNDITSLNEKTGKVRAGSRFAWQGWASRVDLLSGVRMR